MGKATTQRAKAMPRRSRPTLPTYSSTRRYHHQPVEVVSRAARSTQQPAEQLSIFMHCHRPPRQVSTMRWTSPSFQRQIDVDKLHFELMKVPRDSKNCTDRKSKAFHVIVCTTLPLFRGWNVDRKFRSSVTASLLLEGHLLFADLLLDYFTKPLHFTCRTCFIFVRNLGSRNNP